MNTSPEILEWKLITTADLVQYFKRFREIRAMYADLEENNYGESWGAAETSDGGKGDIGEAAKNELRLRDRYPWRGSPESLKATTAHEVVDAIWSTVRMADIIGADAEAICLEAAEEEPFVGTPRQALNRYSIAAGAVDELIDPPTQCMFPHDPRMSKMELANYYLKCEFQATVSLANSYHINLEETVRISMNELEANIPREHTPKQT